MNTTEWKPRLIEALDGTEYCHYCLHKWSVHDGMGDCVRTDRRTLTGYCKCSENRRTQSEETKP